MWEPFPGNYVWNLSTNLNIMAGGALGEVDAACRPIREAAARGEDAGTAQFFESWLAVAAQVEKNGNEDERAGRLLSAAEKYGRAACYLLTAERMQARDYPPRKEAYRRGLALFAKRIELAQENCEFVEIPYEGSSFPALFIRASGKDGKPAPCLVSCNGLDSMKENLYSQGVPEVNRRRGFSTLLIDQPGTGVSLRQRDLVGVYDTERWATPALEYLLTREDVDPERIGMYGLSLGGYFAPRAAAMEPRYALCAVMGANHDWGEMQKRRMLKDGENPVPHYWSHVMWVFGKTDIDSFMAWAPNMCLDGVVEKIRVPFLVTHGVGDRQIPVEYAQRSFDQAVNSPKRELKIFEHTDYEVEHCGADNGKIARAYIADWVAETFGCLPER